MSKYMIAQSPQGYQVYVNLIGSAAGHYLGRQPYVINLLKELLAATELTTKRVTIERDMGRVIGNTDIIETTDTDTIFYAQPNKKDVFSCYAKNRFPAPSRHLTVILEKDADGNYEIHDTWIGLHSPPFPGDEKATAKSRPFWASHALVQDADSIQSKTITKVCPY